MPAATPSSRLASPDRLRSRAGRGEGTGSGRWGGGASDAGSIRSVGASLAAAEIGCDGWLVVKGSGSGVGRLVGFAAGLDVDVERAVGSDSG